VLTTGADVAPATSIGAWTEAAVRALANKSPTPLTAIATTKPAIASPSFERRGVTAGEAKTLALCPADSMSGEGDREPATAASRKGPLSARLKGMGVSSVQLPTAAV
jgi:hypothetical protein